MVINYFLFFVSNTADINFGITRFETNYLKTFVCRCLQILSFVTNTKLKPIRNYDSLVTGMQFPKKEESKY